MSLFASFALGWADKAFGLLTPLVTSTPALWTFPIVVNLWHTSVVIAGVLTLAVVVLSGGRLMSEGGSLARSVIGPVILSMLLMFASLRIAGFLVGLNNAVIETVGRRAVVANLSIPTLVRVENDLILWLPYIALMLGLCLVYLIRAAELMVLIVLSPLGLASLAWPFSRAFGLRFIQELTVVIFVQSLQAIILVLSRGLSGLEGSTGPANPLVGIVVLYVLIRAPSTLRRLVQAGVSSQVIPLALLRLFSA